MEEQRLKNSAAHFSLPIRTAATPATFLTGATAADDAYYKDGAGAWTALAITDTFAEIGTTGVYEISLTAGEMNHDQVIIKVTATLGQDDFIRISAIPAPANLKQIDQNTTDGNNATLFLKALDIQNSAGTAVIMKSTGGNGIGLDILGNGTSQGVKVFGGSGLDAIAFEIRGQGTGNSRGLFAGGSGNGSGINGYGSGSGPGIIGNSGSSTGTPGIMAQGQGTNCPGFKALGASGGAGAVLEGEAGGAGLYIQGGASGDGIRTLGGASTGAGFYSAGNPGFKATGAASNTRGMEIVGAGPADGLRIESGSGITGNAIHAEAKSTDGVGLYTLGKGTGHGLQTVGGSSAGDGHRSEGAGGGSGVSYRGEGGGFAIEGRAGATAAYAMSLRGTGGDTSALRLVGTGTGHGLLIAPEGSGNGMNITGAAGIKIVATNNHGIDVAGSDTGHGIYAKSGAGATGNGAKFESLATNGQGLFCQGKGEAGARFDGEGVGDGIVIRAGATGAFAISATGTGGNTTALRLIGGGTGHGILVESGAGATGNAIHVEAMSTNGEGLKVVGKGTGNGLMAVKGTTGKDIDSDQTDFLDVAISSRLASASYTAPDNTGIAAIKVVTDAQASIAEPSAAVPASPASQAYMVAQLYHKVVKNKVTYNKATGVETTLLNDNATGRHKRNITQAGDVTTKAEATAV